LALPVPPPVGRFGPPDPPSPRPPVVIVQHGFSASRQAMDWIVRGLVRNGFAVLAADFRGHGQNPTPFNFGELSDDIASLVAYAQSRPEVNGNRIALIGHSMGAAAVYAYAFQHPDIDAVVPISGSALGGDPQRPHNALLIYASGDPQSIRAMDRAAMTRLDGGFDGLLSVTHGDLGAGTARRLVEVPGNDHVTILFSEVPMREIVDWLRGTWGLPAAPFQASPPGTLREGLIGVVTGLLVFFPLAGFLAAAILRIRPVPGKSEPGGVWMAGVAVLVAGVALFGGTPLSFMPFVAGNQLVSFFLIAGAIYAVWLRWRQPPVDSSWTERIRAVLLGIAAFALVYATYGTAVSRLFFNITLDSQRFVWFVCVSVLFLPLGIGLESALRPAGGWRAVVRSLAAKVLILIGLMLAINTFGTLPPVIGLMIPSLAIVLPIIEAVAARLYTVSGSALASGVLTALFLAWLPAAIFPIGY
jgi:pimeloyl-ACP methyl ester carboxylesterase